MKHTKTDIFCLETIKFDFWRVCLSYSGIITCTCTRPMWIYTCTRTRGRFGNLVSILV